MFRVTILLSLLLGVAQLAAAATPSEEIVELLDDVWQWQMREFPQYATRSGDQRYNDRLAAISIADADRRAAETAAFLERLRGVDRSGLSKNERLERDLLERSLADDVAEHRFGNHLMPISNRSGFHVSFPELPEWSPLDTVEDHENYLSRLRAFSDYADGYIELMRAGIQKGLTVPAVILEGYESSIDSHIVDDPTKSLLFKPFDDFPEGFSDADRQRLRDAAVDAIAASVVPAYRRFSVFMADEYVPNCRSSIGASAMPGGRDFYRHRVRKYTTLDTTPEEVHQRGLAEVKRIRAEMDALIQRVGFKTEEEDVFAAFVEHLRKAPEFYAKTDTELLATTAAILKKADGKLPSLFGRLPRMPYGLKPVPDYIAPKTTFAYYQRPNGDGTRAGFFFLNTFDLASRPTYMLEALALHEAVPGHHLQIALQQELEGMSPLRKYGGFTAFVEGWALYTERLGLEMDFYEDPYSDFGRLTMEVWRALRLVVDTGMHFKGWSRQRAIDYMAANSAMSLHEIRSEIDRYIGWPGQALAYKTGELKIRELRAKAEEQLGDRFDIRAFHDAVLENGAVPLTVLEELIDEWIASVESHDALSLADGNRRPIFPPTPSEMRIPSHDASTEDRAIASLVRSGAMLDVREDEDGSIVYLSIDCALLEAGNLELIAAFSKVRQLSLDRHGLGDAIWPHLIGMSSLESLDLSATTITDDGLDNLRHFPKLTHLDLRVTAIGDAGLAHIAGLPALERLELLQTRVTDAGLIHLARLKNLKSLGLEYTAVGDAGLQHLRGLTGLTELCLESSAVSNDGLMHVGTLTNLETLTLQETSTTEAGLVHLEGLTKLRSLCLDFPVTELGVRSLKKMTSLQELFIGQRGFESLRFLSSQLPDVGVY